jgi:ATP-dependent 26S proteasome regulatory subunit
MEQQIRQNQEPRESLKIKDTSRTSVKMRFNNEAYFKEYFEVCALLIEKQCLQKIIAQKRENHIRGESSLSKKLSKLKAKISSKEARFWRKVACHIKEGYQFAFEDFASFFQLDLAQKRIILVLLYLEFCTENSKASYSASELLDMIDTNSSVAQRLKQMRYFLPTGGLLKNGILISVSAHNGREGRQQRFSLNSQVLNGFSRILNGEKLSWDSLLGEKPPPVKMHSRQVGCLKAPEYDFSQVILTDELKEKVKMFLDVHREKLFEKYGITERIKKGLGSVFLFYGPPGTGKSMLAEAIASYLGKKVLIVEFPKIMSRWLGETDRNISSIFESAKQDDCVVVIDEADALLYNRTYAVEEHDIRFVNEMLQQIERFSGVLILTSNMETLLDSALERRVCLKIKFQPPNEALRVQIWKAHIPDKVELSPDVDFEALARGYEFSGGNIKNAVLNAIRRMSQEARKRLAMEDLIFGAELEKNGMFVERNKKVVKGFAL